MDRRVLLKAASGLLLAGPAWAAPAGLDATIRLVFTQEGAAQEAALRDLVARRDTGAVAALVQALLPSLMAGVL